MEGPQFEMECLPKASMHPHLQLTFHVPPTQLSPSMDDCSLHIQLDLEDRMFIDTYELIDLWGSSDSPTLNTLGGDFAWSIKPADGLEGLDLERPAFFPEGSFVHHPTSLTLEVSSMSATPSSDIVIDVLMHARYLPPSADGQTQYRYTFGSSSASTVKTDGTLRAEWQCHGPSGANSSLMILPSPSSSSKDTFCVLPVGNAKHAGLVDAGTLVAVLAAWGWIMYQMMKLLMRTPLKVKRSAKGKKVQ